MRFLTDQDVWLVTVRFLRGLGHGVLTAGEAGQSRTSDDGLLRLARAERRLLITRDKDYGSLVFLQGEEAGGVILLRVTLPEIDEAHAQLQRLLDEHGEDQLGKWFCVVEPRRYRIRSLRPPEQGAEP